MKDSLENKQSSGKTPGFSVFWQTIASGLGNSRLRINPRAESIKHYLDVESDHKYFLKALILQSYKRCRCYHLNARFDVNIALDILGETSYSLQGSREDDLLDIELLEEIAWLINQHYSHLIEMPESLLAAEDKNRLDLRPMNTKQKPRERIRIVSMARLKIRKANLRQ